MGMKEVFSSKDYCIEELRNIREMWSSKKSFTSKNIEGARYSLGYMALYCPEELYEITMATLHELNYRESYYILFGKGE
jgi:hypothetical protein